MYHTFLVIPSFKFMYQSMLCIYGTQVSLCIQAFAIGQKKALTGCGGCAHEHMHRFLWILYALLFSILYSKIVHLHLQFNELQANNVIFKYQAVLYSKSSIIVII